MRTNEKYCFQMETIKWTSAIVVFVEACEKQSFSLAAEGLGVSKSHVSKTIQELEEHLGAQLFYRTTRTIQLTAEGRHFFDNCRPAVEQLQKAQAETLKASAEPRGVLKVSVAGMFGEEFVAPLLISMTRKYPMLKVELDISTRNVDLVKEGFDVAIRTGHMKDSSLKAQKLCIRKEFICASPEYVEKHGRPLHPNDLKDHQCLVGSVTRWSFYEGTKPLSIKIDGRFSTNSGKILLEAALQGIGIARLPGVYVKPPLADGRLESLLEDYLEPEIPIWIVTPAKSQMQHNSDVFIKEIRLLFQEQYKDWIF